MNKHKILISAPYLQNEFSLYKDHLEDYDCILPVVTERLSEEELLGIIEDFDGVICGDDHFTKAVIDKARRLKVIVKWGTGIDSIDKVYAESEGIKVCNTPGAFTEPVSETVLAYILAFSRRLFTSDCIMKSGGWSKPKGHVLSEATLGIVGLGKIGQAVARKANCFNMNIYGNDIRKIPEETVDLLNIKMVGINELLKQSDYISLNCDLNSTSYHLIKKRELEQMQSNAFLINTARGPIIDENDLTSTLKNKKIAGAAMDVFENEPLCPDSPLRNMGNVILSSHNSNSSPKYWQKVHLHSIKLLKNNI